MMMDRPSLAIHPRLAKSINALFTVSRDGSDQLRHLLLCQIVRHLQPRFDRLAES